MRELAERRTYIEPGRRAWQTLLVGLACVGVFTVWAPALHIFETRYFPVVEGGAWGEFVASADNGIIVSATATKARSCGWRRTDFFLGHRGKPNSYLSDARHLDPPSVRGEGFLVWDRIFLPITRSTFDAGLVFADSFHDCYGGEYLTRSEFIN